VPRASMAMPVSVRGVDRVTHVGVLRAKAATAFSAS